jgi:trehalose 6-phosphate synthase/phosphatase
VLNRSIGGLATALGSVMDTYPMLWIGWAGTQKKLSKKQLTKLHFPEQLIPVAISKRLLNGYYYRLSNGVLWPIMHGIKPAKLSQEADWKATREVTTRFAAAIQENCNSDDVIWIHDYHLVLLPKLLRDRGIENRLGFFLHTPFPEPKTFMKWLHHRQLLESLCQVDVLGFQTRKDAKNFKACLDAAGIKMRKNAVVKAFPIGIDFKSYRAARKIRTVGSYLKRLKKKKTVGIKIVLSVSRLDYTKGIIEQLRAVEGVLEAYGPRKVLYKLVVAPSRETVQEYQTLKQDIDKTVDEINKSFKKKYRTKPIEFEYRSHGFEELNAWYRMADVLLVTPIIDGMNLVVKEYIAAREDYRGAVVLSKTIGAAYQLKEAILVDPQNVNNISKGLMRALKMPAAEKKHRWQALRNNVRREDVFWWTKTFLQELSKENK